MNGALKGTKVIDLSRVLAGPWATQLLADYGADVIKVERPGTGDDTRCWGPPWIRDRATGTAGDAAYFLAANRNKRSITIDLAHPDGQRILRELAAGSDVLVENFRPGTLARYGLDAKTLRAANPTLIWCAITAYGQSGPKSSEPGYDAMIQASAGLMSITGAPDEEGGSPQKVGVAVSDIMAGMYAATAVLAALSARARTGEGQYIDVPLYDSQVAWLANQGMNYLVSGETPGRLGTAHPNIVPYQAFETSDGHLMLAVGNDTQFRNLAACIDRPELALSPKFATNAARVEHRRELVDLLAACLQHRSTSDWLARLRPQVPAGPINDIAEVLSGAYAQQVPPTMALPHAAAGEVPTLCNPVRFSGTPVEYYRAPPLLGEHTDEVLTDSLGYTDAEIRALREAGAI